MKPMVLSSIIALLFMLLYGQIYDSAMAESLGRPLISIPETTVGFQAVPEGTRLQHEFTVYNKGPSTLNILDARAD